MLLWPAITKRNINTIPVNRKLPRADSKGMTGQRGACCAFIVSAVSPRRETTHFQTARRWVGVPLSADVKYHRKSYHFPSSFCLLQEVSAVREGINESARERKTGATKRLHKSLRSHFYAFKRRESLTNYKGGCHLTTRDDTQIQLDWRCSVCFSLTPRALSRSLS